MAARCYSQRKASGWMVDRRQETAETERLARRAIALGKDDAVALCTAGIALECAAVGAGLGLVLGTAIGATTSGWHRVYQRR